MEPNKQLPQLQEILDLLKKAREYSIESLKRVEKLNSYATQIQGHTTFLRESLKEQAQIMEILSDQNPELEILQTSKDRFDEMLSHFMALSQMSEKSLEILDLSASEAIEQEGIIKASSLLKSVIACLDLIEQEKLEAFVQTTTSNQSAGNTQGSLETLQALKNHLKG